MRWMLGGTGALLVAATVGAFVLADAEHSTSAAHASTASTAMVERGTLSTMISLNGIVTYRARPDGSPYVVINQARGIYTALPDAGDQVACGDVLYRVDDHPVLLLCGTVPAYRDLHEGDVGNDVLELNANLHQIGGDAGMAVDQNDNQFTERTQHALEALQRDKGLDVTGQLHLGDAVVLPGAVRIATVNGDLGGTAQPGVTALRATFDTLEVRVDLDPSQQGDLQPGARVRITLPGNESVSGEVDRLGKVARFPAAQNTNATQNSSAGDATVPAYISLDEPGNPGVFDQASVRVEIATEGVNDVLSVAVTALVGRSGGGLAVEVVRAGGQHELVAVEVGLFDTTTGRVQVDGDLREGDLVVVPSS